MVCRGVLLAVLFCADKAFSRRGGGGGQQEGKIEEGDGVVTREARRREMVNDERGEIKEEW